MIERETDTDADTDTETEMKRERERERRRWTVITKKENRQRQILPENKKIETEAERRSDFRVRGFIYV